MSSQISRPRETERKSRKSGILRACRWLLGLALALVVGYWVGANWFLNSEWGNRQPDKLEMVWDEAWTWIPGVVHVEKLRLEGHNRRADWFATADGSQAWLWLPSLLNRHVKILRFPAHGVEVDLTVLPKTDVPPSAKKKRGWRVSLGGLDLRDLRRLHLAPYTLEGAGRMTGDVVFQIRETVALDVSSLVFDDAVLRAGEDLVATGLRLQAAVDLDEFVVGNNAWEDLIASGDAMLQLDANSASLGFLDRYLSAVPMLEVGGTGPLSLFVEVADGWLSPDSHFELSGPAVSVAYAGLRADGNGRVVGRVVPEKHHAEVEATLETFGIVRPGDGATLAQGEALSARITNDSIAIDRPASGIAIEVSVPPARVPDLAAFAPYVPAATGLALTGGQATLSANLVYDSVARAGEGALQLFAEAVEATYDDLELVGNLKLEVAFPTVDMDGGMVGIGGTRLDLTDIVLSGTNKEQGKAWWGNLTASGGSVRWTRPTATEADTEIATEPDVAIDAQIQATLLDTSPVTALLTRRAPRMAFFDQMLTVENVALESRVQLAQGTVGLHDLRLTGGRKGRLEVLGQLDLRQDDEQEGVAFARLGKLSAALQLGEGKRDWKLTRSRVWYEEKVKEFENP